MAAQPMLEGPLRTLESMPAYLKNVEVEPLSMPSFESFLTLKNVVLTTKLELLGLSIKTRRRTAQSGFELVGAFLDRHESDSSDTKAKIAFAFCRDDLRDEQLLTPEYFRLQAVLYHWMLEGNLPSSCEIYSVSIGWKIVASLISDAAKLNSLQVRVSRQNSPDRVDFDFKQGNEWIPSGTLPDSYEAPLFGLLLLASTFSGGQLSQLLMLDLPEPFKAQTLTWLEAGAWLITFGEHSIETECPVAPST